MTITAAALNRYTAGTARTRVNGPERPAIRYPNGEVAAVEEGDMNRFSRSSTAARTFRPNPAYHAVLVAEMRLAQVEQEHTRAMDDVELTHQRYEAALAAARKASDKRLAAQRRLQEARDIAGA